MRLFMQLLKQAHAIYEIPVLTKQRWITCLWCQWRSLSSQINCFKKNNRRKLHSGDINLFSNNCEFLSLNCQGINTLSYKSITVSLSYFFPHLHKNLYLTNDYSIFISFLIRYFLLDPCAITQQLWNFLIEKFYSLTEHATC